MEQQVWDLVHAYLQEATPAQWHIYVARSNYDDNGAALQWLIDNPQIDRATALMIYWNLGAEWYAQFDDSDDLYEAQRERVAMLRLIEERYPDYYANQGIWFDPKHSDGTRPGDYADITQKRAIPAKMLEATTGSEYVDTENPDGYDEGLPLELVERIYDRDD